MNEEDAKVEAVAITREPVSHKSIVIKSVLVVIAMVAFVFVVLVPMYEFFCEWTGLTGRTGGQYEVTDTTVDENRLVKVQFLASNNADMPWKFNPMVPSVEVNPGEVKTVFFYAKNTSGKDMVAQAVPSLSPFQVTEYFHKTECFCFDQQPLEAGEEVEMGLQFIVDKDIPDHVNLITLSYTLFDVTQMAKAN